MNRARPARDPITQLENNTWQIVQADESGLLVDARDYYHAFYRAALTAQHYIVMAGWQFDRGVKLLRGSDVALARRKQRDVRLLKFLDGLCASRPNLHVYMLAWDFHMVFALEREWMQRMWFDWTTNERLHFLFDDSHVPGGCHHQKFVVIDGQLSFLGGIDLCESRWDDRQHDAKNRQRTSRGRAQKPYHDVQSYFTGRPVADALTQLFRWRWRRAGGDEALLHTQARASGPAGYAPRGALRFPRKARIALSRTEPRLDDGSAALEIRALYLRAIAQAERLIYLETQYLSSRAICRALSDRMREASRPRLQIVLVVNPRAEAMKEEIAVGLRQAEIISHLRQVASATGHALGIYFTIPAGQPPPRPGQKGGGEVKGVYIHSKLMVVDDRLLTVGSANLTNRSMGIDSELNATWETKSASDAIGGAIRRARISLLAEHVGARSRATLVQLARPQRLVQTLDALVARGDGRLCKHPSPTENEAKVLDLIDPQALPFDPESVDDESAPELADEQRSLFKRGLSAMWDRIASPTAREPG